MRAGFLLVFVWPLVALQAFWHAGAWAWAFVPVLLGLGIAELTHLWWRTRAGQSAALGSRDRHHSIGPTA
jgi:hypothetical protein